MATKKATAKKPAARKSRRVTATKRSAKHATRRRAARKTDHPASWTFTRMLANIFGLRPN